MGHISTSLALDYSAIITGGDICIGQFMAILASAHHSQPDDAGENKLAVTDSVYAWSRNPMYLSLLLYYLLIFFG